MFIITARILMISKVSLPVILPVIMKILTFRDYEDSGTAIIFIISKVFLPV